MLRKIAQFVFWKHLRATLWASGIVLLVAALNQLGLVYAGLQSIFHMEVQTYQSIDAIFGPVGLLSLIVYVLSLLLNRRRKTDSSFRHDRQMNY